MRLWANWRKCLKKQINFEKKKEREKEKKSKYNLIQREIKTTFSRSKYLQKIKYIKTNKCVSIRVRKFY